MRRRNERHTDIKQLKSAAAHFFSSLKKIMGKMVYLVMSSCSMNPSCFYWVRLIIMAWYQFSDYMLAMCWLGACDGVMMIAGACQ
jgi:hypothetical protein